MAVCFSSAKLCVLRVARLNSACACVSGATNGAVTSGIIRLQATPEYDTGQEYLLKNGCGDICVNFRDCDRLKRLNLSMELCTRDMELLEILTGGSIYTSTGTTVGFSRRGTADTCPSPVFLEIWTRAIDATGTCVTPTYKWWRVVYPKATFTLGESSFENGVATVQLTGFAEPNPLIAADGCWNDITLTLDTDSPEHFFLQSSEPPTAVCGYTAVPAQ